MFVEYDFSILIKECLISSYTATQKVPNLTYIIGEELLLSPIYVFEESPQCNYLETVTVTDLPSFAVLKESNERFEVPQTEDLTLAGTYKVKIRSEIQVPIDGDDTNLTTWFD